MLKLLVSMSVLAITGCTYQTLNTFDLQEAEYHCVDKGGVVEIYAAFDGREGVTCGNNEQILLHKETLK